MISVYPNVLEDGTSLFEQIKVKANSTVNLGKSIAFNVFYTAGKRYVVDKIIDIQRKENILFSKGYTNLSVTSKEKLLEILSKILVDYIQAFDEDVLQETLKATDTFHSLLDSYKDAFDESEKIPNKLVGSLDLRGDNFYKLEIWKNKGQKNYVYQILSENERPQTLGSIIGSAGVKKVTFSVDTDIKKVIKELETYIEKNSEDEVLGSSYTH